MPPGTDPTAAPAAASRDTPRTRLARVAHDAALRHPDVRALDAGDGGRWCTWVGAEPVPGVVAIADGAPGTYAVTVHVRARLVPLRALAAEVRTAVLDAARRHVVAGHVGEVRVVVTDVLADDEAAPPATATGDRT